MKEEVIQARVVRVRSAQGGLVAGSGGRRVKRPDSDAGRSPQLPCWHWQMAAFWNRDSSELTPEGAGFTADVECVLSQAKNDSRVKAGVSRLDLNYSRRVTSPGTLQLLAQARVLDCCTIPRFRPRGGQLYFVKRPLILSFRRSTGQGSED